MELEELETGLIVNTYETIIIFDPTTDTRTINSFKDICQEFTGGTLKIKFEDMGEKELTYPYKRDKREIIRGHFIMIMWQGTAENVKELENQMRINDEVLKFMTVKREGEELEEFAAIEEESEQDVSQDAWDRIFNN